MRSMSLISLFRFCKLRTQSSHYPSAKPKTRRTSVFIISFPVLLFRNKCKYPRSLLRGIWLLLLMLHAYSFFSYNEKGVWWKWTELLIDLGLYSILRIALYIIQIRAISIFGQWTEDYVLGCSNDLCSTTINQHSLWSMISLWRRIWPTKSSFMRDSPESIVRPIRLRESSMEWISFWLLSPSLFEGILTISDPESTNSTLSSIHNRKPKEIISVSTTDQWISTFINSLMNLRSCFSFNFLLKNECSRQMSL